MNQEIKKSDFEIRVEKLIKILVRKNLAYSELLELYAKAMAVIEEIEKERDKWKIEVIKAVDSLESIKDVFDDFGNNLEIINQGVKEIEVEQEKTIKEKIQTYKKELAIRGVTEKLKRDPRQEQKKLVRECWVKWQLEPSNYSSKAEFARDMREKYLHLKSNKKIEDWCREWEKEKRENT